MKANEIVIKIYNQRTLRADIGEQLIREYAMNVAHQAYLRGYDDRHEGRLPNPEVGLSEIDTDNYNK
jgi:hypothetical protein